MELFKVVGVGILGALLANALANIKNELYLYVILATGVVLLIIVLNRLSVALEAFMSLADKSGVDDGLFAGLVKIIGIGYVTDYSAGICRDTGANSVAGKLELYGKITIFIMALPLLYSIIELMLSLTELI